MFLPIHVNAGEVILNKNIYKKDDGSEGNNCWKDKKISDDIYLIFDGEITVSLDLAEDEKCSEDWCNFPLEKEYKRGCFFGDYRLFYEQGTWFKYTAKTNVKMYVLPGYKFFNTLKKYENIYKLIKGEALKRHFDLDTRFKHEFKQNWN